MLKFSLQGKAWLLLYEVYRKIYSEEIACVSCCHETCGLFWNLEQLPC